jgi:hypothetical protein
MNTRNLLSVIAFGGLVALVACSSSEEDKFASSDAFCSSKAEAECNGLSERCGATLDACKTERTSVCKSGVVTAQGQGRTYKPGAVQDCLDSIARTYPKGGSAPTQTAEAETAAICERVLSGSKKESAPCASTYECDGALICDKGVCVTEEKVAVTKQCNNAGQVCETGSYCQQQGATKFCNPKNALGDSCSADAPCVETLRCLTGHCAERVTAGQACDNDGECGAAAPYCDIATKKCRPKYESTSAACQDFGL